MTVIEIPRDQWGRPKIIPLDAAGIPDLTAKPIPYVRVSTMAKTLDDTNNLTLWKQRNTALGLAARPDLVLSVAALMAKHKDVNADFAAKKKLNSIIEEAFEAAGGSAAASLGTALHELSEALDAGQDITPYAGEWMPRLEGYRIARSDLEVLDMETFVVNDVVQAAGSFDRLVRLKNVEKLNEVIAGWGFAPVQPGVVLVDDLKTGAHDSGYPLGVATQIGTYANSHRYDPTTGERSELDPALDKRIGLLTHMPAKGDGIDIYPLNLQRGWYAAQYAKGVYDIRKWKVPDLRGASVFSA